MRRGEVWLACLDPVIGHEIAKTRPVVIVSNDANNRYAGTVSVLPITSRNTEKIYPFEVFLPLGEAGLPKASKVKADQVRTLDKRRLVKRFGALGKAAMTATDEALSIHLGLN